MKSNEQPGGADPEVDRLWTQDASERLTAYRRGDGSAKDLNARATRLKVFHDAADTQTWIGGAHLGRPGIGRVMRKQETYDYKPAE